jgi:flagellar motor component MotA
VSSDDLQTWVKHHPSIWPELSPLRQAKFSLTLMERLALNEKQSALIADILPELPKASIKTRVLHRPFSVGKLSEQDEMAIFENPASVPVSLRSQIQSLVWVASPAVLKSLWISLKHLFAREERLLSYQTVFESLSKDKNRGVSGGAHPLIAYASDLWSQGIEPDLFIVLLSQKRNEILSRGLDAIQALKNLSKYPPALGMTGTVMGIVNVFYALDQNKDSIGLNLSMAMTATFLGLILANVLISPLADRLDAASART